MTWRPTWWLDFLKYCWPLSAVGVRATRLPILGKMITTLVKPVFGEEHFNISYIPIHKNLDPDGSTVITERVIAELVRRSSHRVIIKRCTCRDAGDCQTYPVENACLMLGEGTRNISPEVGRPVSIEEALEHVTRQIGRGLTPMTGRVRMDDLFYGVPNQRKMLTVCFCCPCCCAVLHHAGDLPIEIRSSIVRLKGVRLSVDAQTCRLCGRCVEACFVDAISIQGNLVLHDEGRCIGCGRCATVCPEKATMLSIDDPEAAAEELLGRIRERVSVE